MQTGHVRDVRRVPGVPMLHMTIKTIARFRGKHMQVLIPVTRHTLGLSLKVVDGMKLRRRDTVGPLRTVVFFLFLFALVPMALCTILGSDNYFAGRPFRNLVRKPPDDPFD